MTAAFAIALVASAPEITLRPGMVLTKSCRVQKADYLLPSRDASGKQGVVTVKGDNIEVDFQGATLRGSKATAAPDERPGTAIRVQGRNITLRNVKVHGYKIGLYAQGAHGLKILDSDFSYNWRQRLKSTVEREDLEDWMSYHHNEADEWLRYGAAIYLSGCDGFKVRGVTVTGGSCALMMTKCDNGLVVNNDFSFNSAVGIGLYRSSENKIVHNKLDWCVRGYSHGVYSRGQDSTGFLVYEQSNSNLFAFNSATHGGDGFFLWAGQTTMDTGEGGCNDNVVYGNDFSHSPANGIEATFSRNKFVNNLLVECGNGVWGGYSYDTLIAGNVIALNGTGVAIEHGQFNDIFHNTFAKNRTDIRLWSNPTPPDPNWGYPKFRDTRNIGSKITDNFFVPPAGRVALLERGKNIEFSNNVTADEAEPVARDIENFVQRSNVRPQGIYLADKLSGHKPDPYPVDDKMVSDPEADEIVSRWRYDSWSPTEMPMNNFDFMRGEPVQRLLRMREAPLPGGQHAMLPQGALRGRQYIIVDEWGPYDFRRPLIRHRHWEKGDSLTFDVLGPKGKWRVKSVQGGKLGAQTGAVPGTLRFTPDRLSGVIDRRIELEYVGGRTVDARGVVTPAGKSVAFGWEDRRIELAWDVAFWTWQQLGPDPKTPPSLDSVVQGEPVLREKRPALDFATSGSPAKGVPADHFLTVAETKTSGLSGSFDLSVTSDDGVRVSIDGRRVIDEWHYQGPTTFTKVVTLRQGSVVRIEHFEIDGYTTLQVQLTPRR